MNSDRKSFSFRPTTQASVLKLLEEINPSKSAGIDDNLAGKFLKEAAHALAPPTVRTRHQETRLLTSGCPVSYKRTKEN